MSDRRAAFNEEGLPWLEAVADEDGPRRLSARKMFAALMMVIVAAALIAGTFFLIGRRNAGPSSGPPELIKADPRPYKVKPADPGGLDVAGDSQTAFATSTGTDTDAQIDMNAVPEAPVARPEPKPKLPEPTVEVHRLAQPAPAEATPAAAAGSVIQLGAFSSAAKAEAAWKALTARFETLNVMSKIIVPVSNGGGGSLYRLRAGAASPADAKAFCQTMRVAGESCVVIG
ncbi:MAG: SPOR domain-containing protein [Sphingomicrobium sp.]